MRRSILACGLLLACAGMSTAVAAAAGAVGTTGTTTTGTTTAATTTSANTASRSGGRSSAYWSHRAEVYRAETQHWLTVITGRPPRGMSRAPASSSASRMRQVAAVWRGREHAAWHRATHPPLLRAWDCIHHHEGSWTDHGAPYWGGLQMDYSFQSTYAPWLLRHKGTADHWSSFEQIWTGVRAWRVRGFSPWSSTAHDCGVY